MKQCRRAILAAALVLLAGGLRASPVIVVEPTVVDFGRQLENKGEYAFSFAVKNAGDAALEVTQVRPGCSCTKVEIGKKTLAPGEATQVTGVLTTKGIQGQMRKGITITSNDPEHQNVVATVAVRFPFNGVGLRLQGQSFHTRVRDGALWAYVSVENCEPETTIEVQAMELPEGWDSTTKLPLAVSPEERGMVVLTRPLDGKADPEPFDNLPFVLVTDSAKTPRVEGSLAYRPLPAAVPVQPAPPTAAPGTPQVRWPMTRPATPPAAVTAPPQAPAAPPAAPQP